MQPDVLNFYRQQSSFTTPGKYVTLYDALPDDPAALARVVQGLLMQGYTVGWYGLRPGDIEDMVFGVRAIEGLIEHILKINGAPLAQPRQPRERLGANCRNFAALWVSMLRHKGIPARERVGFGGYFGGKIAYDHRITEYWDAAQGRWVLADAMIDDVQRRVRKIRFNPLGIQQGDPFTLAGHVWQQARREEIDPKRFGDSDTDIGMPPIRYALLHDFDALNGFEVLGSDSWGDLSMKPEYNLTDADRDFLDQVAAYTRAPDEHFAELRDLHHTSEYGRQMRLAGIGLGFS